MKLVNVKSFLFLFLSFTLSLFAQTPDDLPKKPPNDRLVYDYGNVMSLQERSQLETKLVAYNDSTSTQIAVITFKSLNGYPIEALANDIGEKWGVGEKGKDNGIVLLMSKEDRKVTLRGGYGMQVKMPPTIEKLIIDNDIIPWFKEENYYNGLNAGVDAIFEVLSGQYQADPKDNPQDNILGIVILVIALVFLVSLFFGGGNSNNSSGGSGGRRRGFFDDVIITNSGRGSWSGGGFGGSSGGGFGGFGGGSFGGGGASGSW